MNKPSLICRCVLVAVSSLLLQSGPVFAEDGAALSAPAMAGHMRNFNWVQHTQRTLEELKVKLNLSPQQMAVWNTWSGGVMKDAHQQYEPRKSGHQEKGGKAKSMADGPTPERMAHEIERLRDATKWMQEHLVQLEAAQLRTKEFYDALDTNQKTIFDLFWHKVHLRAISDDDGRGMPEPQRFGPVPTMRERSGPAKTD